jgi:hypothetical protein
MSEINLSFVVKNPSAIIAACYNTYVIQNNILTENKLATGYAYF